jgi:uncharacterized protein (DUF1330 family)
MAAVTYVLIARIPAAGVDAHQRYEAAVLPLLADHGGRLARRLRSADGGVEVHVIEFASGDGLDAYRADPRRAQHADLLATSGAQSELLEMRDVPTA